MNLSARSQMLLSSSSSRCHITNDESSSLVLLEIGDNWRAMRWSAVRRSSSAGRGPCNVAVSGMHLVNLRVDRLSAQAVAIDDRYSTAMSVHPTAH
ncbi:unnamed protein product [Arctia plantaginis]|uniref:Uncharacterized protein n=1 Tax=Arctia plantaginis TaxID=874455 RepID=A0A8S0ZVC3_ARCPL|nr:unnamed protein product [Arctia plantaginis]